jgi:GTP cyclohydrolase II
MSTAQARRLAARAVMLRETRIEKVHVMSKSDTK